MTSTPVAPVVTQPKRVQPKRVQRKRTKGWRMPPLTIYVGRPTHWGNPFVPDRHLSVEQAVAYYRDNLLAPENTDRLARFARELAGRDLACWCPLDQPCHADVLLDLVNRAPAWALCSDCRLDGLTTCGDVVPCWSPMTIRDLLGMAS